eukprot:g2181.t1
MTKEQKQSMDKVISNQSLEEDNKEKLRELKKLGPFREQVEIVRKYTFGDLEYVPNRIDTEEDSGNFLDLLTARVNQVFRVVNDPYSSILGRIFSVFIMLCIFVAILALILESIPDFQTRKNVTKKIGNESKVILGPPVPHDSFCKYSVFFYLPFQMELTIMFLHTVLLEKAISFVFIAEYFLKLLTLWSTRHKDRSLIYHYLEFCVFDVLNFIDLVAILPFFINFVILGEKYVTSSLNAIRVLRLLRVCRVFKMGKYHSGMKMLWRVAMKSTMAIGLLMFILLLCCVFFGSLIFVVEHGTWSEERGAFLRPTANGDGLEVSPFTSIPDCMWWVVVTGTTVGYGDLYPTTLFGRLIGVCTVVFGVIVIALPISIIGAAFEDEFKMAKQAAIERRKRMKEHGLSEEGIVGPVDVLEVFDHADDLRDYNESAQGFLKLAPTPHGDIIAEGENEHEEETHFLPVLHQQPKEETIPKVSPSLSEISEPQEYYEPEEKESKGDDILDESNVVIHLELPSDERDEISAVTIIPEAKSKEERSNELLTARLGALEDRMTNIERLLEKIAQSI